MALKYRTNSYFQSCRKVIICPDSKWFLYLSEKIIVTNHRAGHCMVSDSVTLPEKEAKIKIYKADYEFCTSQ